MSGIMFCTKTVVILDNTLDESIKLAIDKIFTKIHVK